MRRCTQSFLSMGRPRYPPLWGDPHMYLITWGDTHRYSSLWGGSGIPLCEEMHTCTSSHETLTGIPLYGEAPVSPSVRRSTHVSHHMRRHSQVFLSMGRPRYPPLWGDPHMYLITWGDTHKYPILWTVTQTAQDTDIYWHKTIIFQIKYNIFFFTNKVSRRECMWKQSSKPFVNANKKVWTLKWGKRKKKNI